MPRAFPTINPAPLLYDVTSPSPPNSAVGTQADTSSFTRGGAPGGGRRGQDHLDPFGASDRLSDLFSMEGASGGQGPPARGGMGSWEAGDDADADGDDGDFSDDDDSVLDVGEDDPEYPTPDVLRYTPIQEEPWEYPPEPPCFTGSASAEPTTPQKSASSAPPSTDTPDAALQAGKDALKGMDAYRIKSALTNGVRPYGFSRQSLPRLRT
jgi:hypothetical protein